MIKETTETILRSFVTHETYVAGCETKEGYIPEDCIQRIVDKLKGMERRNKMVDQKEVDLIIEIVDRGWECGMDKYYKDKLNMMMDISAANEDCPLKLQELLDADYENFVHNITGIRANINRQTKKLENCFVPRFAK